MKNDRKIIFVDVDDVCAMLAPVWISKYNYDYGDNLTVDDLKSWHIEKHVKPECGLRIYDYIKDPKIYNYITPREGSVEGVDALREMGFKVLFNTSAPISVAGRKYYWLLDWGYGLTEREYIEIRDKSLLLGDYMFDDSHDNVSGFSGHACLLTRPWNEGLVWGWRVDDWPKFVESMRNKT